MDFNESSVFVSWGQVYSGKGVQVESVLDLKGQPLALVRKDINSANFKKLAAGFQVKIDSLEVDSYDQAGKLVSLGQAKAMILPNVLSRPFAGRYHLHPTPIIFNPVTSSFASPKGKNNDLLQAIDRHLQNWKQDKISVYYAIVDKWLPAAPPEPLFSRNQISALLYGLILIGALLAAWMGALRHQVKTRTRDLTESEERYRRLFDTSPVGVISPPRRQNHSGQQGGHEYSGGRERGGASRPGSLFLCPSRRPEAVIGTPPPGHGGRSGSRPGRGSLHHPGAGGRYTARWPGR